MRIAVLHDGIRRGETDPSILDVVHQAKYIAGALQKAGHETVLIGMYGDASRLSKRLKTKQVDCIFNLVEAVHGRNELIHLAPQIYEKLGVRYTGSNSHAMAATTNKARAKEIMRMAGIPTPDWAVYDGSKGDEPEFAGPWILKPLNEDASVGIDDSSVVRSQYMLKDRLREMRERFQQPILVEQFISGREFNISIISARKGPKVLPPAEMMFKDFPEGKPKIVGYAAKWDENAFEYWHTVRRFVFPTTDSALLERLKELTLGCWLTFGLNGYARVDFRVDENGEPFVIEVNVNPCLSPDSGFPAAARRAGLPAPKMVQRILEYVICPSQPN